MQANSVTMPRRISRARALEAATRVIFYRNQHMGDEPQIISYPRLALELNNMGMGPVTPAELSDLWRNSSWFEPARIQDKGRPGPVQMAIVFLDRD
jgi:hypothetical protein